MKRSVAAGASGLFAAGLAAATPILAGASSSGYSASAQYISELGALGAVHAEWVNFGGFLPIAICTAALLVLGRQPLGLTGGARIGWWLLGSLVIGYGIAALFQCDAGCPASGSPRQLVHNLGGLVEYAGCFLGLLLIGSSRDGRALPLWLGPMALLAALGVAVGFVMMSAAPDARGGWQRCAEFSLFAWLALVSVHLLRAGSRDGTGPLIAD